MRKRNLWKKGMQKLHFVQFVEKLALRQVHCISFFRIKMIYSAPLFIAAHRETEADEAAKSVISSGHDDSSEVELTKILVHELYRNREEVLLLINGAGGSSMENAVDLIIDEMDEHNLMLTKAMCDELQIPMIHQALVHWMSHNQVDMFLYMIQHIEEEEQALAFAGQAMNYLLGGWYGMFGVRG